MPKTAPNNLYPKNGTSGREFYRIFAIYLQKSAKNVRLLFDKFLNNIAKKFEEQFRHLSVLGRFLP